MIASLKLLSAIRRFKTSFPTCVIWIASLKLRYYPQIQDICFYVYYTDSRLKLRLKLRYYPQIRGTFSTCLVLIASLKLRYYPQIQDILQTRSAWDRQGELSARLKVDKLAAMFPALDADAIQQLFIINKYAAP